MSKVSIGDEVFETTDLLAHQQFNLWLFELVLPDVDLVIELLDARLPVSSQNPTIAALRGNKLGIKILSKSDLAEPEAFSSTNRCRKRFVVQ